MKKIILSAAALCAFAFSNAQEVTTTEGGEGFKQGDFFITGAVGFGTVSNPGDLKSNTFVIAPKVGFFATENIAVGIALGYSNNTADENDGIDTYEVKNNTFEVGAFGRYYFTPASKFSIFGQLNVAYATSKTEVDVPGTPEYKANGFNIGVAPGLSYFVSEHFALEATFGVLGYNTAKPDVDGAESTDAFNVGLNLSDINLGLVYKF
jgi:hypothetical protein